MTDFFQRSKEREMSDVTKVDVEELAQVIRKSVPDEIQSQPEQPRKQESILTIVQRLIASDNEDQLAIFANTFNVFVDAKKRMRNTIELVPMDIYSIFSTYQHIISEVKNN